MFLPCFLTFASLLKEMLTFNPHKSESLPSEPCSTLIYTRQKVAQSEQQNGWNRTKARDTNFPSFEHLVESPTTEKATSAFTSEAVEATPPTLQTIFYCLNNIPLPPFFLRLILILCPYTKRYVPCSPFFIPLYWDPFYTGQTKQRNMVFFFFLIFLPLIGFTVLGIWKKPFGRWRFPCRFSLDLRSVEPLTTNKGRKGIYMASLIIS